MYKKIIVRQVGYSQEMNQDARSTTHKIPLQKPLTESTVRLGCFPPCPPTSLR